MQCNRCLRADAKCVTSPIFRMRNYRGKDDTGTLDRARRRQRQETGFPKQETVTPSDDLFPRYTDWLNRPLPAESNTAGGGDATLYETIISQTIGPAVLDMSGEFLTMAATPPTIHSAAACVMGASKSRKQ